MAKGKRKAGTLHERQLRCRWCNRAVNAVPVLANVAVDVVHPACLGKMQAAKDKLTRLGPALRGA